MLGQGTNGRNYPYAIGYSTDRQMFIGDISNSKEQWYDLESAKLEIKNRLLTDMWWSNWKIEECQIDLPVKEGQFKIAVFGSWNEKRKLFGCYCYREDENGWTHKTIDGNVSNKDSAGKIIENPITAKHNYVGDNYSIFIGCYVITKK